MWSFWNNNQSWCQRWKMANVRKRSGYGMTSECRQFQTVTPLFTSGDWWCLVVILIAPWPWQWPWWLQFHSQSNYLDCVCSMAGILSLKYLFLIHKFYQISCPCKLSFIDFYKFYFLSVVWTKLLYLFILNN